MADLFDNDYLEPQRYPHSAGHRGVDTSIEAAEAIAPSLKGLRAKALRAIRAAGMRGLTACELAEVMGVDRMAAQPRTTELKLMGLIRDSKQRRPNPTSGKNAIVWIAIGDGAANDQHGERAA